MPLRISSVSLARSRRSSFICLSCTSRAYTQRSARSSGERGGGKLESDRLAVQAGEDDGGVSMVVVTKSEELKSRPGKGVIPSCLSQQTATSGYAKGLLITCFKYLVRSLFLKNARTSGIP